MRHEPIVDVFQCYHSYVNSVLTLSRPKKYSIARGKEQTQSGYKKGTVSMEKDPGEKSPARIALGRGLGTLSA